LPGPAVHALGVFDAVDGKPQKRGEQHQAGNVDFARRPDERQTTLDSAQGHPERSCKGKDEHDFHRLNVPSRAGFRRERRLLP